MSELKWDQVQLPSFGGSVQNQIAAAQLLDDAIGKGIAMNNNISANRRDNTMKGILGNLTKFTTGEEANEALRSGSLLDGVDLSQLRAEDLRALQKDIMGVHDLENKGIKNTQGYLDHDLTRANTGLVGSQTRDTDARTAQTYQTMRESANKAKATAQSAANKQQFQNFALQNIINKSPEEIDQFLSSDELAQAQQAFGASAKDIEDILGFTDKRMTTSGNLLTGAQSVDGLIDHSLKRNLANKVVNTVGSADTTDELNAGIRGMMPDLSPEERELLPSVLGEIQGGDPEIAKRIDTSATTSATELQQAADIRAQREVNASKEITPESVLNSTPAVTVDTLDQYYKDFTGAAKAEEFTPIEGDISEVNMENINPNMSFNTWAKSSKFGMSPEQAKGAFDGPEFVKATQDPEFRYMRDLPWTEENLSAISNRIREYKSKPTEERVKKDQVKIDREKEQVTRESAPLVNKYLDDFRGQGLTGAPLQKAAREAAELEVVNNRVIDKALAAIPDDTAVKLNERDQVLANNFINNPSGTSKVIQSDIDSIRDASLPAIKGVGYYDTNSLSEVSNNIGDVAKAIVEQSGIKDLKPENVARDLRDMGTNINADARTLGSLYKAVGNKLDIDTQKEIYKASRNPTNNATASQMQVEHSNLTNINSRITKLSTDIATLANTGQPGWEKAVERKKAELETLTLLFNQKMEEYKKYSNIGE